MTAKEDLANQAISKEVANTLDKAYPGHAWAVKADVITGIVTVHNLNLSGEWGFILKIDALINDPSPKPIILAGGELLERFNLSRGKLREDELDSVKRDLRGAAIHED